MSTETIDQLQSIGIDPARAQQGVIYGPSGTYYRVVEFFSEAQGIKTFRVSANGQLKLRAAEQVRAIFS